MIAINSKNINQQTIEESIFVKGIGLHSGKDVELRLEPAEVDNGIQFIRVDSKKNNIIEAIWSNVSETLLSTTISNEHGLKISTIEHLMSALVAWKVSRRKNFISTKFYYIFWSGSANKFL